MPVHDAMRKPPVRLLALLISSLLFCAGCAVAPVQETASAAPHTEATPYAVAAPIVVRSEPRFAQSAPESVPEGYTAVTLPGCESLFLYAFTDAAGEVQHRVFCERDVLTDGAVTAAEYGFAAVRVEETSDGAYACMLADSAFIEDATTAFGVFSPEPMPEGFVPRRRYEQTDHLSCLRAPDGSYLTYGRIGGGEAAFYPSDAQGNVLPGALALTGNVLVPDYTPMDEPNQGDPVKLVVYIGSQSVAAYRAVDGEWVEARVMVCSTGKDKDDTPRGDFRIMAQYLYKKLGMNNENLYGQYSSRVTGNYLFHSVPITGPEPQNRERGKRQMSVKYYGMLGTPASGGCIRLRVLDALWIYTFCTVGTPVTITDAAGPIPAKPAPLLEQAPYVTKIGKDYHGGNYVGWDPSDPDPNNPYAALYPAEDWAAEAFAAADATDPQKQP